MVRKKSTERKRVYLGIDPGANGGLAYLFPTGLVTAYSMPSTLKDLWTLIHDNAVDNDHRIFAVIEKVGGFIQGNASPGSAMFNFGVGYGTLLMALTASGIPHEDVTPQRWQKGLGIPPRDNRGNESKTSFKNRLKAKAQSLYPRERVTHSTADALLIATYAQRKFENAGLLS